MKPARQNVVEPGEYTVVASAEGYLPADSSGIVLAEGEAVVDVDFDLVQPGSISGTVAPTDAGAVVHAIVGTDTVSVAEADSVGGYVLADLAPGTYTVAVSAEGYQDAMVEDVEVAAGEAVTGVDFTLTVASASWPSVGDVPHRVFDMPGARTTRAAPWRRAV